MDNREHRPPSSSNRSGAPPSIPVPGSSRIRNPPPPSPLSQINSPASDAEDHRATPVSPGVSLAPPATIPEPLTSPCYIHSYLDKHGSGTLADYLNHHGSHGTHASHAQAAHGGKHEHHQHQHQQQRARRAQGSMPNGLGAALEAMNIGAGGQSAGAGAAGQASDRGSATDGASHGYRSSGTPGARDHSVKHSARHSPRFQHHQNAGTGNGHELSSSPSQISRNDGNEPRQGSVSGGSEYGGSDRSGFNGMGSGVLDGGDFDEDGGSLTKQLAETAQGVREMSRELGRTVVKSRIHSVLIVTKARDNRLIKLTRELAVYLMSKRTSTSPSDRPGSAASTASTATASGTNNHYSGNGSSGDRGLIVYVDAQLRKSKRFNAAGIKEEHPEFFRPTVRRRSSSSMSISTISAAASSASLGDLHRKRSVMGEEGQLRYWTGEMCSSQPHLFDFVITLGGDGTVLFTSWLFQKIVPPVLPFALGSLGFLTNFDYANYRSTMDRVIDEGIRVNLRMRFTCTVYRAVAPEEADCASLGVCGGGGSGSGKSRRKAIKKPGGEILMSQVDKAGWEALEGGPSRLQNTRKARMHSRKNSTTDGEGEDDGAEADNERDKEIMCFTTRPVEQFEVLNDLVVDRGPSPYVSLLEIFGDEHHLTTVQADGLTVSTPTGSTAYSLSAGGSLVHPQIPAILLTPICPHTLSFRPMLLPDGMELRICVPYNSRSTAWASFDGRGRVELKRDHIKVTASKYPFPTVSADKASTDWFSSVSRTLRWNEREKQKSFVVVEEDAETPNHREVIDSGKRERREERVADNGPNGTSGKPEQEEGQEQQQQQRSGTQVKESRNRADAQPKQPDMGGERRQKSKEKAEAGMDDPHGEEAQKDVEKEEEEEEEDDEEFDIDDKSGDVTPSSPMSPDQTPTHGQSYEPSSYLSVKPVPGSHPSQSSQSSPVANNRHHQNTDPAKSGVNTPDRFVTHHSGPPPLSQRHLIDKLQQAQTQMHQQHDQGSSQGSGRDRRGSDHDASLELKEKEGERGQRDEIREDPNVMRVQGAGMGMLPSARGSDGRSRGADQQHQHQHQHHGSSHAGHTQHSHHHQQRPSSRRAASDMSYTSTRRAHSAGRGEGRAKAFAFFGQDDSASDMSDDLAEM